MLKFFGKCSVMLWKKTKVLCKRHVTTRCISMLRNSRWDKLKWHLYLRWQLHMKLVSIISPHSEKSVLWFYLDCSISGWNERETMLPKPGCTGYWTLPIATDSPKSFRSSAISRTHVADEHRWKRAQETRGATNAGMRPSLINSWNGPILLWNSGWNVWCGKARWSWFFLNTLFPSGLWITVVWGSWARTK